MFLVELVMQGVRRFKDLTRLRFQSGFNLVFAGNESGKTTAIDTITTLLFPRNDEGRFDGILSRQTPDASRGALVVYADDSNYYRVIQDFSRKGVNLSKYNPATKEFVLQNKDWAATAGSLNGMIGGISEQDFDRIFVLRREHYRGCPASASAAVRSAVPAPVPPRQPAAPARSPEKEARLAELKAALHRAEEAAEAEYRFQSAKMRVQEIVKKQGSLQELDTQIDLLEQEVATFTGFDTLPENLAELIDDQERSHGQRLTEADQIRQDIDSLKAQRDSIPSPNIATDPLFLAGAAAGVGTVIAALFFLTTEQAAFFPIGVVLALGLVAGAWYRSSRKSAERSVVQGEIDTLEAQIAEVERGAGPSGGAIEDLLKATGSKDAADLKERTEAYRYQCSHLSDLIMQRERLLGEGTRQAIEDELRQQQEEAAKLEQEAQAVAKHNIDTYSMRQEIERIEQELAGGQVAAPGFDLGGMFDEMPALHAAAEPEHAGGFHELEVASRACGIEQDILMSAVASAAQRNLQTVTNGAYVQVDLAPGAEPAVFTKDNERFPMSQLSHATADSVYFCLRAGLVEAMAGKVKVPFLLDDPFTGLDPARQMAACQVLRALGAKTQVLLFTANPAFRLQNEQLLELK